MPDPWQVIRCRPDQYANPAELRELWADAATVRVPGTVAAAFDACDVDDADDTDWWQRCIVEVAEHTAIDFRGLSFPAAIHVDGAKVADCESMFLPVRIDVGPGRHELCIRFGSLNQWLKTRRPRGRWRSSLVGAPGLRWARTTLLGRAPVYGDVPAPVGVWRPVVVVAARRHVALTITADPRTGDVEIGGATGAPDGTSIDVEVRGPADEVVTTAEARVAAGRFTVSERVTDPQLWWPNGYGPQHLYRVEIRIDGEPIAQRTFGFRSVTGSPEPAPFQVFVNGVPVFCRGVTWSPPDAVGLHVDRTVMREHVAAFADAGATMVRIVGGLVYEQDEFWECCAELGVLVWQDAMLATFDPPAELSSVIAEELATVLDAVSGNPALAVVSGGSETLQRPEMLGLDPAEATMDVVDSLLPAVVARHSDALYVRSSPAPPAGSGDLAIRPDTGVAHWFGVGGYLRPITDVRSAAVQFAAECLAFSNPPTPEAVERHFGSAAVAGHDPRWKAGVPRDRGASWDFEDVRDFYAREVFGEDLLAVRRVDPDRYLQVGRLAVAEAMRECFAFWRRSDSGCTGALVLSGKDTTRGAGWGLFDVDGDPKAALHVLRRIWAPVAVVLSDGGLSGVRVDVYNDTPRPMTGELGFTATTATGVRTIDVRREITVGPHSSQTYTDAELSGSFRDLNHAFGFGPPIADAIEATVRFDDSSTVRDVLVVNPRRGQVNAGLQAIATPSEGHGWNLLVSTNVALRYVTVDIPGWTPSDDVFHLAAGLPYTIGLVPRGDRTTPTGTIGSIDLVSTTSVTITP